MAITALHTAATGMQALSTKIDVIANNIANADTVGFKSSRANFQDLLYQIRSQPGVQTSNETASPLPLQVGLGVAVSNTQLRFTQGSAMQTGIDTDVMIQGDGLFQLELPGGGIGYTRAGNFVINQDGEFVLGNSVGHRLLDTPTVPQEADDVSVGANGQVIATVDGEQQILGQIQLARFANPGGLIQRGLNLYTQTEASGDPLVGNPGDPGFGSLLGGSLELSNTEAVTELVDLIKTQRVFQMNSQTINTADESLQTLANLRR